MPAPKSHRPQSPNLRGKITRMRFLHCVGDSFQMCASLGFRLLLAASKRRERKTNIYRKVNSKVFAIKLGDIPFRAEGDSRRGSTVSGAEIYLIQKKIRHLVRILATFCGATWALGLVVFSISAWSQTDVSRRPGDQPPYPKLALSSFAGASTFLTGTLGYWGSLHLKHTMVCIYSYVIYMASIIEMCVGAVILSIRVETLSEDTMELVKNETDEQATIFRVQKSFKCCGSSSPEDWIPSAWWRKQRESNSSHVVPRSCCRHRTRKCNSGTTNFTRISYPSLIHQMGCAKIVLARQKYIVHVGGGVLLACGVAKLLAFFAIHYLADKIMSLQRRLEEIREQLPSVAPLRMMVPPQHNKRLSLAVI
ncbi:uncharacterized protein CDAR_249931 [Caerostris darwini]|uniref:Tetraspanin n=1 Tax=Caerostris darwini TaxID=1538125 RepID=A0AAV4NH57_9ARAC|nr:uncharacterized protein CDAR_249931 [Caerostris darwini]